MFYSVSWCTLGNQVKHSTWLQVVTGGYKVTKVSGFHHIFQAMCRNFDTRPRHPDQRGTRSPNSATFESRAVSQLQP